MNFDQELHSILEKLLISDGERAKYNEDAVEIQNHVMEKLKLADKDFCEAFDGLSLAGSYLDREKLKTPDEFDLHLKLKFPFKITPRKSHITGYVVLRANKIEHPIVENSYINERKLQDWLKNTFNKVFTSELSLRCKTGEVYEVKYKGVNNAFQTIEAKGINRDISFNFVPTFEFNWIQWPLDIPPISAEVRFQWPWFAVLSTKIDNYFYSFKVCAPSWEREITKDLNNFKNVLRLMKGLRDARVDIFPGLSNYMLKTVMIHQIGKVDWKKDLGTLLMEMWSCLVNNLKSRTMYCFLAMGNNILPVNDELNECRSSAERILYDLNETKNHPQFLGQLFNV